MLYLSRDHPIKDTKEMTNKEDLSSRGVLRHWEKRGFGCV